MLSSRKCSAPTTLRDFTKPLVPGFRRRAVQQHQPDSCTLTSSPSLNQHSMPAERRSHVSATASADSTVSVAAGSKEDVTGRMLEPSIVNKPWVRAAVILLSIVAASGSTVFLPMRTLAFVHVLAYAIMMGASVWNTFFVGLTMFKCMPRQTFGKVQAKLFPMFFALTTACNVLILGTWLVATGDVAAAAAAPTAPVISLFVALVCGLANWFYLEPQCTSLMFERYNLENKGDAKTEEDKARIAVLYKKFGAMHGISALVNLIQIGCLAGHSWVLASRLTLAL